MKNVISATCNNCGAKYDNLIKGVTPGSKVTLYGCDKCVGLGEVEAKVVTVSGEPTKFEDVINVDTILQEHREWMRGVRTDHLIGTSHKETKEALHSLLISKLPDTPENKAVLDEMFEVNHE